MALNWGENWGLTDKGFLVPSYQEVLDIIQDGFISRFGSNIPLTSNSQFGIIAATFAWQIWSMLQQLGEAYNSAFIDTATGTALDRIGSNYNIPRKPAKPATANLTITTNGEYLIQAGEQFETEDGQIFNLENDLITTKNSDGSWSGTGEAIADESGSDGNVPANSITVESNPDEQVLSVTNNEQATGGQDYEEDYIYRQRIKDENADRPSPTRNGIESAILALNGVRQCFVKENPGETVDSYGNPPESVHVYVLGGRASDIAQTLEEHKAIGTNFVGTQAVNAESATGEIETIHFDFANPKPIYVKVTLQTNDEFDQDDGVQDVKDMIVSDIEELEMGNSIRLTKLYPDIYSIPGIEEAQVELGLTPDNLTSSDIPIAVYEAPTCQDENVQVVINGN